MLVRMRKFVKFSCLLFIFCEIQMVELFCDDGYSEKLSDEVCIDYWYNKADLPTKDFWTGIVNETTVVEVNVSVKDFPMVDDMTKTMTLQLNVETAWTDRRLDVNFTHFPGNKFDIESEAYANLRSVISLDKVGMLWQPDLVIEKLVNFKILSVLEPLRGLLVDPYYRVTHNVLCTVTVSCSMDFDNFPLDTQLCDFALVSANYASDEMKFTSTYTSQWNKNEHGGKFKPTLRKLPEREGDWSYTYGNYTFDELNAAGFTVVLERSRTPYVMKYYLPAAGIVLVSQMSFMIPLTQLPGRVALLVTLFLVLTNVFTRQQAETPESQTMTALGEYLLSCLFFVFFALVEFAIVLKYKRKADATADDKNEVEPFLKPSDEDKDKAEDLKKKKGKCDWFKKQCENFKNLSDPLKFSDAMDEIAQILFILAFILFNIIYWTIYSS